MAAVSPDGPGTAPGSLRIGAWELDSAHNELRRAGEAVRLEPKVIEVLAYLARQPGHAVPRDELLAAVWPGVVVGDDALTQAIIKLRKALGDDAHQPTYIETISKRGYRLIAPVERIAAPGAAVAPARAAARRRAAIAVAAFVIAGLTALVAAPHLARLTGMPWPIAADARGGAASAAIPTVAVLPLVNLGGDASREYFVDGVTEDVIHALGRFSGLRVMSRNAVQAYKGKAQAPREIRTALGARYIVQGSVRESGGKVRVTVELSDSDTGAVLWTERYESEGAQLLEIQDRIAKNIVGKLQVRLARIEEQRVFSRPTESLEAYDLLLRARSLLERAERAANREARGLLARAQQLAPSYVEVHTALGEAEFQRALYGWIEDPGEGRRRAEELAGRALASPDQRMHSRAHALLASIYSTTGQFEPALEHAERALELNPSDSAVLYRRGGSLLYVGRIDEAIATLETARRFDPYPVPLDGYQVALAYYTAGRYREALSQADAMLSRVPDHVYLHSIRAATLSQLDNAEEARRAGERVRRLSPYLDVENLGRAFRNREHMAKFQDGLRKAGL